MDQDDLVFCIEWRLFKELILELRRESILRSIFHHLMKASLMLITVLGGKMLFLVSSKNNER